MTSNGYASELSEKICSLVQKCGNYELLVIEPSIYGKKYIYQFKKHKFLIESYDDDICNFKVSIDENRTANFVTFSEQIDILHSLIKLEIKYKREIDTLLKRLEWAKQQQTLGKDPKALGDETDPVLIRFFEIDKDRIKQKMRSCFN